MKLSREFVEWFLALAGAASNLTFYRLSDLLTFEIYTQLYYWDLFFKAYKVSSFGQKGVASKLLQDRLRNGMVSLAYPVECVSTHTTDGGMIAIVWENGGVTLADEPTLETYKSWAGEGVLHG